MKKLFKKIKVKNIKIKSVLYYTLLGLVVLLCSLSLISSIRADIPFKIFTVDSGSMTPTIRKGDLIFVKTNSDNYEVNDIITFKTGSVANQLNNTHRIIEKKDENTYVTKGDFNEVNDMDPVIKENIVGKYIFRIPLIGFPIIFIRTVLGFILLIVIPTTILIYEEIKKIKYEISLRKKTI